MRRCRQSPNSEQCDHHRPRSRCDLPPRKPQKQLARRAPQDGLRFRRRQRPRSARLRPSDRSRRAVPQRPAQRMWPRRVPAPHAPSAWSPILYTLLGRRWWHVPEHGHVRVAGALRPFARHASCSEYATRATAGPTQSPPAGSACVGFVVRCRLTFATGAAGVAAASASGATQRHAPGRPPSHTSNKIRVGSSMHSLMRLRNVTASRPSTMRWS